MFRNNLRLLLGNQAGLNALKDYIRDSKEQTELALNAAARSALFKPEDRDYALTLHGKLNALADLLGALENLDKTSTEGK